MVRSGERDVHYARPDGLRPGDPNLYRYCGNNPISATDPSGLAQVSYTIQGGGAAPPPGSVGYGNVTGDYVEWKGGGYFVTNQAIASKGVVAHIFTMATRSTTPASDQRPVPGLVLLGWDALEGPQRRRTLGRLARLARRELLRTRPPLGGQAPRRGGDCGGDHRAGPRRGGRARRIGVSLTLLAAVGAADLYGSLVAGAFLGGYGIGQSVYTAVTGTKLNLYGRAIGTATVAQRVEAGADAWLGIVGVIAGAKGLSGKGNCFTAETPVLVPGETTVEARAMAAETAADASRRAWLAGTVPLGRRGRLALQKGGSPRKTA